MRGEAVLSAAGQTDPMLPRRARVRSAWRELDDAVSLSLEPVDGDLAPFAAGQFNMLYAFGVGEAAISVSSSPDTTGELIHTIRDVGAVSGALTRLKAGDMLGLRGPFGTAWPVEAQRGRHLLIMAGGLGLAPLRPALLQALARRDAFAGVTLLMGARDPGGILFPDELAEWTESPDLDVVVTVDSAAPGWTGSVGVVTTQLPRALAGIDPTAVSAFVCGPEIMMRHSALALADMGVPDAAIWLSLERNMKCAIGFCGHCQFGPDFVCKDGPVFPWPHVAARMALREI